MDALTTPLPKAWQRVRLGDIATFLKGKGLSKSQVSSNAKHECILYGELFTYYDRVITNIKNFTNIYNNPILSLSNDVLMSGSAETPDILATASCILKEGVILGGDILIIRPNSNLLNGCFLAYCIVYDKNQVLSKVVGSTVYHLYAKDLKDFEILLPPLNEQAAIANVLSDVDHYLYSLDALILKKESVKKALSFELLSQRKRLKGFNQAWQRVRLGDICEIGNGGAYETLIVENGNFKLISLNSIDIDGNLKNTMKRVNFYDNSLKQDDIVMVLSDVAHGDFLGLCAVIPNNDYVLNQRMGRLRKKNDCINILFLRLYINANQKYFKMQGQGSSQLNLSKKAIEDFEILLPPLNEQIAIANILSGLDHEIISLKNKKRQFENIKKALNHDLMSAKIRVLNK
ncbi:restriction endonuclease subunit S [Helicobacter pylori]|uniref:restriction endonuclease subunit S n=1 Tax=Helicobacter pylori TaxID=210 RepID=UPI000BE8092F|nr:restriction endonuclease subunit S [Helicobacter pylori]PDX50828.1 restriction endonuclease subunit S [Helicobacter pylori]QTP02585.1 restriction endonuclease subunit S [Helicobacter pylori]